MSPSRSDSWDATGGASIVCSAFPSIGRTSGDIDSLDVDELPDAVAGELAPITALLHAPEGEARVGSHDLVHKDSAALDRKSTRLNSSHSQISYAVFCLKKKK